MRTAVHDNSIAAYRSEGPKLSARERLIYDHLERVGPRTDRALVEELGFRDMNSIRPRVTELIEAGRLMEVTSIVCPVTKKRVRVVDIRKPRQGELLS